MTLEKAIEILIDLPVGGQQIPLEYRLDACNLGTEALKGILSLRRGHGKPPSELLPGETQK